MRVDSSEKALQLIESRFMMKTIALDADDTLWENIDYFLQAQSQLCDLLKDYVSSSLIEERLFKVESQNIPLYGYGTKSFVLSMVELAIEITDGKLPSRDILKIHDFGRAILLHPVELLRGVEQTIPLLASEYNLIVVTKGDLLEQEQKLDRSGLRQYLDSVHVMPNKRTSDYQQLFNMLCIKPENCIMVGNTLKSDVLPVIELGGAGIYIPHHYTWEHELVDKSTVDTKSYVQLEHFGQIPSLLQQRER